MRDNHDEMIELLAAEERQGNYFAVITLSRQDEQATFEFGVSRDGYLAVKHILQARPFVAGLPYRYFFKAVHAILSDDRYQVSIRVEQGRTVKAIQFEMPKLLVANLIWFRDLTDFSNVNQLRRLS